MMENQQKKEFDNGVIYKITNPNGRVYIGQTINFQKRKNIKNKSQTEVSFN